MIESALKSILNSFYPDKIFDIEGLVKLIQPCLAAVVPAVLLWLILKIPRSTRRYAYVPFVIMLIILMTGCIFFPVSMGSAGDYAFDLIRQMIQP